MEGTKVGTKKESRLDLFCFHGTLNIERWTWMAAPKSINHSSISLSINPTTTNPLYYYILIPGTSTSACPYRCTFQWSRHLVLIILTFTDTYIREFKVYLCRIPKPLWYILRVVESWELRTENRERRQTKTKFVWNNVRRGGEVGGVLLVAV